MVRGWRSSLVGMGVRVVLRKWLGQGQGVGMDHLYSWHGGGSVKTHCTFDDIHDEKQHGMAQGRLEQGPGIWGVRGIGHSEAVLDLLDARISAIPLCHFFCLVVSTYLKISPERQLP